MNSSKIIVLKSIILLILFTTTSCSTKKKTWFHKSYHNTTAKYNGYFNGNESLKQGVKKIHKAHTCGFEDCRILNNFLDKYDNISICFENFSNERKPNGDGVQELSMHNFIVMRDKTADPKFLLQKKIEKKFSDLYPNKWTPLYSMVSFTNISYSDAWRIGLRQEKIMKKVMQYPNIENVWDDDEIMQEIHNLL